MTTSTLVLLKTVRWTGWVLLPLVLGFFLTGYIMDGRFGLNRLLAENAALAVHRMLHLPLGLLVLAHSVAALYLAVQRWGWFRRPERQS
jgi:hypothetical protein